MAERPAAVSLWRGSLRLLRLACQAVAQRAKAGGEGGIGSLRLVLRTRALRAPSSLRFVELRSHPSSAAAPRLPSRFAELPPLRIPVRFENK